MANRRGDGAGRKMPGLQQIIGCKSTLSTCVVAGMTSSSRLLTSRVAVKWHAANPLCLWSSTRSCGGEMMKSLTGNGTIGFSRKNHTLSLGPIFSNEVLVTAVR